MNDDFLQLRFGKAIFLRLIEMKQELFAIPASEREASDARSAVRVPSQLRGSAAGCAGLPLDAAEADVAGGGIDRLGLPCGGSVA